MVLFSTAVYWTGPVVPVDVAPMATVVARLELGIAVVVAAHDHIWRHVASSRSVSPRRYSRWLMTLAP